MTTTFEHLKEKLLSIGGKTVPDHPHLSDDIMLEDGKTFEPTMTVDWVYGWALNEDGVWKKCYWESQNGKVIGNNGGYVAFYGLMRNTTHSRGEILEINHSDYEEDCEITKGLRKAEAEYWRIRRAARGNA